MASQATPRRTLPSIVRGLAGRAALVGAALLLVAPPASILAHPPHGWHVPMGAAPGDAGPGPGPGPGFGFGPGGGRGFGHRGPGGGPGADHLAARLELTDEQRETVRGIVEAQADALEELGDDLIESRKSLFAAIHAASFDEAAIRAASARVAVVEADLAVARGRLAQQIQAVLTAEQREELARMHERLAEFAEGVAGMRLHGRLHGRGPGSSR